MTDYKIHNKTIYLLPGRGNQLEDLGSLIMDVSYFNVCGRLVSELERQPSFAEQLEIVKEDLLQMWLPDSKIVAHSWGAYLLLQTLADLPPYPGSVLLVSPVVGGIQKDFVISRPPRGEKILRLAQEGTFPLPVNLSICVGDQDDMCNSIRRIGQLLPSIAVSIVANQ